MAIQLVVPERREGGVYDFSTLLAGALRDRGEEVELVHLDASSALSWRPSEHVVVQYSGYGFAKRGAPVWLLATLAAKRRQIRRLGVFFHELYAEGPPTTSAFWLSPAQKGVARGLAELCDFWMTSREGSAAWLRQYAASKPRAVLPVFSNVGELLGPLEPREPRVVVFGQAGARERLYAAMGTRLAAWCAAEGFSIDDLGTPIADRLLPRGCELRVHGRLDAAGVSRVISGASMAALTYPPDYIAKSGVFAAYAAHGVAPIVEWPEYDACDGLTPDENYLRGTAPSTWRENLARVAYSARDWYLPHSLSKHASTVLAMLRTAASHRPSNPGSLTSDARHLWAARERPDAIPRTAKVWMKRARHAPNLARILWTSSRLRAKGAQIGRLVVVGPSKIEGDLRKLTIGDETSLGRCELAVHDELRIGRRVVVNDGVVILTATHGLSDPTWRTKSAPVFIDDYAWIATNAIILPGSRVGRGAVVGAGAVVRGEVPSGAIVTGNPAVPTGRTRTAQLDYSPVLRNAPLEAWAGPPRVAKP